MGGGGASESSSQQKPYTPKAWRPLQLSSRFVLEDFMKGGPQYGGPYAAGLTGDEATSIAGITNAAGRPFDPNAQNALDATLRGDFLRLDSNPFALDAIRAAQRPVLEAFEDNELMDRFQFGSAGHALPASSPFAMARAKATSGLANSLGDISSEFLGRQFQAERQNQLAATDIARQLKSEDFSRRLEALQAQALPRLIAQYGIDKGLEEFRRRAGLMLSAAQVAGGMAAPIVLGESSSKAWNMNVDASSYIPGLGGG